MLDKHGVLQTDPDSLKQITLGAYKYRLRNREMKPELKERQQLKENFFRKRMNMSKKNKTPDWTLDELNLVLDHLKKDASRDPHGYANEIFRP